jgi:branched-subunit amino acid aminotransferase/4-amino-4-deoxychorismate lyase
LERKEAKLMINIVSENNVRNGELIAKKDIEQLLEQYNTNIYEVIRVINKKPVFLKEHFNRMKRSIELSKLNSKLQYVEYKTFIELLINENSFENCNIRVSYLKKDDETYLMYFVKSYYPPEELYEKGISVVMVTKHRKNPNIKFYESDLREGIDKILSKKNAFEAILINDDDTISEGSKSNVFFVKGDTLITSKDSSVLLGVTREKVIDVCNRNGIKVEKRDIFVREIKLLDGAFITGTSINVLPIKNIDDIVLDSSNNEIVKKVSDLYLNEVNLNINQNK